MERLRQAQTGVRGGVSLRLGSVVERESKERESLLLGSVVEREPDMGWVTTT